jgi:hypothetical protein
MIEGEAWTVTGHDKRHNRTGYTCRATPTEAEQTETPLPPHTALTREIERSARATRGPRETTSPAAANPGKEATAAGPRTRRRS